MAVAILEEQLRKLTAIVDGQPGEVGPHYPLILARRRR